MSHTAWMKPLGGCLALALFVLAQSGTARAATLVDTIPIGSAAHYRAVATSGGKVFLAVADDTNPLRAYDGMSHALLWQADFAPMSAGHQDTPASLLPWPALSRVFATSDFSQVLKAYDMNSGAVLGTYDFEGMCRAMGSCNVMGTDYLYLVEGLQVHFLNPSTLLSALDVALTLGTNPVNATFDDVHDTLLIPMSDADYVLGLQLSVGAPLSCLIVPAMTNPQPYMATIKGATADFDVICEDTLGVHDRASVICYLGTMCISSPIDSYYTNNKTVVVSYHDTTAGTTTYKGGIWTSATGPVWYPNTYPARICKVPVTGYVYVINRGIIDINTGLMGLGGLWKVDLSNGSLAQNLPLGGGNYLWCFDSGANRLYIPEPQLGTIKVFTP